MPGRPGEYQVLADGEVIVEKRDDVTFLKKLLGDRGIPPNEDVVAAIRARLGQ